MGCAMYFEVGYPVLLDGISLFTTCVEFAEMSNRPCEHIPHILLRGGGAQKRLGEHAATTRPPSVFGGNCNYSQSQFSYRNAHKKYVANCESKAIKAKKVKRATAERRYLTALPTTNPAKPMEKRNSRNQASISVVTSFKLLFRDGKYHHSD